MSVAAAPSPVTAAAPSSRVIAWTRTVAAVVLGLGAVGVWWPVLGSGTLWVVPVLGLTAGLAGGVVRVHGRRLRLALPWLWLPWLPIALIVAGLPAWTLNPLSVGTTARELGQALSTLLLDPASPRTPWMLGAWLVMCGLVWSLAAGNARRNSRASAAAGFLFFAAPFACALAFSRSEDAAWQGGVILIGGLLWTTRGNLRDGFPALVAVAVVSVVVAALIAPTERWSGLDPVNRGKPPMTALSSEQTYGPQQDSRTGATMFEISATRPSLWRMETLERFDGHVWKVDNDPAARELPQPMAQATTSTITLDRLSSDLAFAPGRIESVSGDGISGGARRVGNEAVALTPRPQRGQSYTAISEEVDSSPALASVPVPTGRIYQRLTQVAPVGADFPNPAIGRLPEQSENTPIGRVVGLAEQLSGGTDSQLEIVERVVSFLKTSGTFRYTLDVAEPGPSPLIDFLLNTRAGYCQHFAGAAALLLRLAGVPTRVVGGFATGTPSGENAWKVRDKDAHAWIEVYYPEHGWVAYDPTAPGADAQVAPGVGDTEDVAAAAKAPVTGRKIPAALLLGVLAVIGLAFAAWRLRRTPRREPAALGDVLAGIVPAPAGPSMTFAELRDDLRTLGPAVAALADEAERQRFDPSAGALAEPRPRRRVWGALLADVGPVRAARILLLGPGRRPIVAGGTKVPSSAPPPSVAPPGSAPPG